MSWDERHSTVRAELRVAQREADNLCDPSSSLDGAKLNKARAILRKKVLELDRVIKDLAAEAAQMEPIDLRQEYERKVETSKEQRKAILESLGRTHEGGVFAGIRRAIGMKKEETEEPLMFDDKDDEQLLDMQNEALQEQDEHLDRLHSVILRQKHVAGAIGQELDDQVDILDTLERGVDRSNNAVRAENKRMDSILQSKSDSRLTCAIVLLLLIFLGVMILALY